MFGHMVLLSIYGHTLGHTIMNSVTVYTIRVQREYTGAGGLPPSHFYPCLLHPTSEINNSSRRRGEPVQLYHNLNMSSESTLPTLDNDQVLSTVSLDDVVAYLDQLFSTTSPSGRRCSPALCRPSISGVIFRRLHWKFVSKVWTSSLGRE